MIRSRLSCENLSVAYRCGTDLRQVLRDVSIDLAEGEFVSLVGPSGCGKTTLIRTLAGFVEPRSGSIAHSGEATSRSVGLVLQEHSLFPWMTAVENTAFALEMQGVARREREEAACRVLRRFGLEGRERSFPHQLSSGMKQRVAVARAFLSGASLLLMDEPFGALDALTRHKLQQELMAEWSIRRPAVLFVTHDVDEAILLASRVLVMSSEPAGIVARVDVSFSYPRQSGFALTRGYVALKREIYSLLGIAAQELSAVSSR